MPLEQPEIRLIRQALEGAIASPLVSPVLFDALDLFGKELPETLEDLVLLVEGPLRQALASRVGETNASRISNEISGMLAGRRDPQPPRSDEPFPPVSSLPPADEASGTHRREREATRSLPVLRQPVTVMVISSGTSLVRRLQAALGPERVYAWPAHHLQEIAHTFSAGEPAMALVDASDFPMVPPQDLARGLVDAPRTAVCALWAVDMPYGKKLSAAAVSLNVQLATISRSDGVEPLLDLIRSRQQ